MKNLKNYGVLEMDAKEINEINGGDFGLTVLAGLVIAAGVEIVDDWENFKAGLSGSAPVSQDC